MTLAVHALTMDAHDPAALAGFWGDLLGWPAAADGRGGYALEPTDETGFRLRFVRDPAPRTLPNYLHFDLTTTSLEDQAASVARVLELGGRHHDVGQSPDEDHVVLADPEGNEMCVTPPGNRFLAGCPRIGCLSGDGSGAVGRFWSSALGWPLVWDQDEETAIQSPAGGPKMSWGGPPYNAKPAKNRVHLDLVPAPGSSQDDEVERLLGLGAVPTDIGQDDVPWVVLADPDGNQLCVLP
ncbi:VOC family protein [Nocardioides sp. C4-1]|uniref:VOC family protein n=1 Tax=Nocardioides sp. C4-1 TaxID=3151851 RepID=UPI003264CCC9